MAKKLHVDIETFSSIDISKAGSYKYMESIDFEILMVAFAIDDNPVEIIDLAQGEELPRRFIDRMFDPTVEKWAHNATFERNAFKTIGIDVPANEWYCSSVKAGFCGLPLSLDMVSKALKLEDKAKLATGKKLIQYFCVPVKPTKVNGGRSRNFPEHDPEKWIEFKDYCMQDVEAERAIDHRLEKYIINDFERINYILDQKINDKGIRIDLNLAANAVSMDSLFKIQTIQQVKDITGVSNPNSPAQLKDWLSNVMQKEITTLAKDTLQVLIDEAGAGVASEVLGLRKKLAKTSIKKYTAMLNCVCEDIRARGLFQFYGANRTGRWAGRLIQLQNLPKNKMKQLDLVRKILADNDYDLLKMLYDEVPDVLSELIRTAFVPEPGNTFAVGDFSAIEARVIAWLADEKWRLEVFATHGKIYEASAAMMFGLKLEDIKKGSPERDKGKVAELALGYQGALGALKKMGGEKMGLSDAEMTAIVNKWRLANPQIVKLWRNVEACAIEAIKTKRKVISKFKQLGFEFDGVVLTIELPSGRKLYYQNPSFTINKFGKTSIQYKGLNQETKQWVYIDTYGGKLIENIVQAIARDCLAFAMQNLDAAGFNIVMHVHDEAVTEVPEDDAEDDLNIMCQIMGQPVPWAPGLLLPAEGYTTNFYKKD